ncbi:hypothetical protein PYW08_014954 [Mythimna loreyi]|uniref:Uncharacterized protein n=1 Tax=Mythimna loreyi TaxID=667449 RepID=A0ACC2R3B8_9NEOP|nr:hypothetical protein PYW08_014954 [Mythimna loreyi]
MSRLFFVMCISCVAFSIAQFLDPFEFHQECGPNEVAKGCINPCPPEKTCQDRENYACLAVVVPCVYKCHCKEGFIRKTEGGECIPEEKCGPYCGNGQEYTDCKKSCLNETCSAIMNPSDCVSEDSEPCKPGCICRDGYFRIDFEDDSPCVPRSVCQEIQDSQ